MKNSLSQIWQRFQKSFSVEESVKTTTETSTAILEAAKTIQEQGASLEALKPVLQNSSSLLDVLCSPLAQVVGAGLPFVPLAISLLKFYKQKTDKELTLVESIAIISQAAYVASFVDIISKPEHKSLQNSWTNEFGSCVLSVLSF